MRFLWPEALWLALLLPLMIAAYVWLLRRRKRLALRVADLSLIKRAMGTGGRWRQHLPPALFLIALAMLLVAAARPTATITLPSMNETVVLAMDVSGSMRAKDVEPDRITAAQVAARAFVADQPPSTRIAVVTFAATASVVQPPTHSRDDVLAAIDRFKLQRGTATGSGVLVALQALFPDMEFDLHSFNPRRTAPREQDRAAPIGEAGRSGKAPPKPVEPGSYASAAIILLSDGARTTGPDPLEAARMAAERGVRVFTVGFGTPSGEIIGAEGWSMRVRLDEGALKGIADITRGQYFYAGSAEDLKKVYEKLNAKLVFEKRDLEVSALFAAGAAVLLMLAGGLSVLWFGRVL